MSILLINRHAQQKPEIGTKSLKDAYSMNGKKEYTPGCKIGTPPEGAIITKGYWENGKYIKRTPFAVYRGSAIEITDELLFDIYHYLLNLIDLYKNPDWKSMSAKNRQRIEKEVKETYQFLKEWCAGVINY